MICSKLLYIKLKSAPRFSLDEQKEKLNYGIEVSSKFPKLTPNFNVKYSIKVIEQSPNYIIEGSSKFEEQTLN